MGKRILIKSRSTGAKVYDFDEDVFEVEVVDPKHFVSVKYLNESGASYERDTAYTYDADGYRLDYGDHVLVPARGKLLAGRVCQTDVTPPEGIEMKKVLMPLDDLALYV